MKNLYEYIKYVLDNRKTYCKYLYKIFFGQKCVYILYIEHNQINTHIFVDK